MKAVLRGLLLVSFGAATVAACGRSNDNDGARPPALAESEAGRAIGTQSTNAAPERTLNLDDSRVLALRLLRENPEISRRDFSVDPETKALHVDDKGDGLCISRDGDEPCADLAADRRAAKNNRELKAEILAHYPNIKRHDIYVDIDGIVQTDDKKRPLCGDGGQSETCAELSDNRTREAAMITAARRQFHIPSRYEIKGVIKGVPQCPSSGEGETDDCRRVIARDNFEAGQRICLKRAGLDTWENEGNAVTLTFYPSSSLGTSAPPNYISYDYSKRQVFSSDSHYDIRGRGMYYNGKLVKTLPLASAVFGCPSPQSGPK